MSCTKSDFSFIFQLRNLQQWRPTSTSSRPYRRQLAASIGSIELQPVPHFANNSSSSRYFTSGGIRQIEVQKKDFSGRLEKNPRWISDWQHSVLVSRVFFGEVCPKGRGIFSGSAGATSEQSGDPVEHSSITGVLCGFDQ